MSGEYRRIQVYFSRKDEKVFRAIAALAKKRGVSMAEMARIALKEWLDGDEVLMEVLDAVQEVAAMDHIRLLDPCVHRSLNRDGSINCKVHGEGIPVERCVGCEEYVSR